MELNVFLFLISTDLGDHVECIVVAVEDHIVYCLQFRDLNSSVSSAPQAIVDARSQLNFC